MRKKITIIFSIYLLTSSIMLLPTEKTSSTGTPVADGGIDQIVYEGDVVQFNGSSSIEALNVLHVSVWQLNELQMIIDYTGSTDKFSVTQVGLTNFNAGTPSDLSLFNAIVFGVSNGYEMNSVPIERTAELKDYVLAGGGIVWAHDSLEYIWDYGPDLEEPAGVYFDSNYTHFVGLNIQEVEIIMDHEILHNIFEIGNVGDTISKTPYPPPWYSYDHTSQSNVSTADIIIQHNTIPGSINFYLTTHKYGQGRVAVDEIGHSFISENGDFFCLPSLKECQVLVNTIYWVADGKNISNIISYSWDFDANVDSDGDGNLTNDIDATGPKPTHIYGDDGIYTVTLVVTDSQNFSDTDTCIITVNNLAPTIEPFGPFMIEEGNILSLNGNATDPGSDDLTFTWNWGDGTSNTIAIYYNDGIGLDPYQSPWGTFPFNATDMAQHIYNNEGFYTINLTVIDDDGGLAVYTTNVTIVGISPPILYINISQDNHDVMLYWDPPSSLGIDYYLIYRSESQTEFDFSHIWINTSSDKESGEPKPIPLRTTWNDTNAAFPGNDTNYEEQFYYVIRAVNIYGRISRTSRTVGKWTKIFPKDVSTFSLPLEPLQNLTIDHCLRDMNAKYIKWMDPVNYTWMKHGDDEVNDTQLEVGKGYEVSFDLPINYTFTGLPGAMIRYYEGSFSGFDHTTEAKNLMVFVEPNGNATLTWEEPASMNPGDWYEVYYSNTRDGFFGIFNMSYFLVCPPVYFGNNTTTHNGALTNNPGTRLYYMVVPFNASGVRGSSTYSIGIWTEEYLSQYDTLGLPLKLDSNHTADWYCENIPNAVGINYYITIEQRWCWHSERMPAEAYDPILMMAEGYQISTSNSTKYTFIGI